LKHYDSTFIQVEWQKAGPIYYLHFLKMNKASSEMRICLIANGTKICYWNCETHKKN